MSNEPFRLRGFILPFYIPAFLWSTGAGVILPILPLHIRALGASLSQTGVIMAMFALGALLGNIPGGALIGRIGKKRAMLTAVTLEAIMAGSVVLVRNHWLLAPILLGLGAVHTLFFVARLAYFRELVPVDRRGRALSLLGGETRMGSSLGPVLGGFTAVGIGFHATFLLFGLFSVVVFLMVWAFVPLDAVAPIRRRSVIQGRAAADAMGDLATVDGAAIATVHARGGGQVRAGVARRTLGLLCEYRRIFLTAGFATLALKLIREGRKVIFPLWGDAIGMDPSGIGLLFGAAYLVELLLFYPAGWVMDHWGRKMTAVPSILLFSTGFLLLPLAGTPAAFFLVAILVAVGNGFGAGINMTLSTDFAPHDRVVEFLALWRTITEAGGAASPVIIGFAASALGLAAAAPAVASIGFAGALVMALGVRETLQRARPINDASLIAE